MATHGQLFALASAEFHEVSISDNSKMVCLEAPNHLLRNRMARIEDFCAAGTFSDPLTVSLLRDAADRILRLDTGLQPHVVEDICLDLIEAAVSGARTGLEDGRSSRLLNDALYNRISKSSG